MQKFASSIREELMTIRIMLDQMAQTRDGAICLMSPDEKRELSYSQLQQRAAAMARRLAGRGFGKGDKIALLLDNGLYTMEVLLGAMYGGLVPVPLSANAAKSELAACINVRVNPDSPYPR